MKERVKSSKQSYQHPIRLAQFGMSSDKEDPVEDGDKQLRPEAQFSRLHKGSKKGSSKVQPRDACRAGALP
jgi:hypothetical protein